MRRLATANEVAEFHVAPRPSPPAAANCNSRTCPWWPYTNSNDFKANTALILVILFCALICSVAFNAAVRYVVRVHCCQRRRDGEDEEDPKPAEKEVEVATVAYAEGMVGESECVICLTDFVAGEKIRVLEKCNHGFHLQCVQKWLVSHSSCPTCRTNCKTESNSSPAVVVSVSDSIPAES